MFTENEPLGPEISPRRPDEIHAIYIDDFRGHEEVMEKDPTFLLGRKGSGKTSLLLGPLSERRDLIVLTESEAYDRVRKIDDVMASIYQSSVDHASSVWLAAFWHVAIAHTQLTLRENERSRDEAALIHHYLDAFHPDPHVPNRADADLAVFLKEVNGALETASWHDHLNTLLGGIGPQEAPLRRVYLAARTLLDERDTSLAIVIDSLEDLQYRLPDLEHVLQGLFRAIGLNAKVNEPTIRIRCCFPSEIASQMVGLTTNPAKDYRRQHIIHWRAAELITLAAERYRLYLAAREPELLPSVAAQMDQALTHEQAREVLEVAIRPKGFLNRNGGEEDPFGYLIRHTQLLPRQVIQLLNAVFSRALHRFKTTEAVPHELFREVILETEPFLADDVVNAYAARYPLAKETYDLALRGLDARFTADDLERHFQERRVKQRLDVHFHEFVAMSIEMGVMGEFLRATDRYDVAIFQYTFVNPEARRIAAGMDADLCLHPLFSGAFGGRRSTAPPEDGKYVYPYGSDPSPSSAELPR